MTRVRTTRRDTQREAPQCTIRVRDHLGRLTASSDPQRTADLGLLH
jgi:hypothetical protein